MTEVSALRTYALRLAYLLNFVGLGLMVWPTLINFCNCPTSSSGWWLLRFRCGLRVNGTQEQQE